MNNSNIVESNIMNTGKQRVLESNTNRYKCRCTYSSAYQLKTKSEIKRLTAKETQIKIMLRNVRMALNQLRELNSLLGSQVQSKVLPNWRQFHPFSPWSTDVGFGLLPSEFMSIVPRELRDMERRFRRLEKRLGGDLIRLQEPTVGKDGFQVSVDVHQFNPNEITVKATDRGVIIEGKHEERPDEHGYISREFSRRYDLPQGFDVSTVTSELSSDGILTIKAPLPKALEGNERLVTIQATGTPAQLGVKENKAIEGEKEKKKEKSKD